MKARSSSTSGDSNANCLEDPYQMGPESDALSVCESDGSTGIVNSPVMKTKNFYSQKCKATTDLKYMNVREKMLNRKTDVHIGLAKKSNPLKTLKSREKNQREARRSNPYLKVRQNKKTIESKGKIRKKENLLISDLITDNSMLKKQKIVNRKAESGNSGRILSSGQCSDSNTVQRIFYRNDEKSGEIESKMCYSRLNVIVDNIDCTNGSLNKALAVTKSSELCEKTSSMADQNMVSSDSEYENHNSDSENENEDCLLRYSSANVTANTYVSDEESDLKNQRASNGEVRIFPFTGSECTEEESGKNERDFIEEESDSENEEIDSSLCSIMDKSTKSQKHNGKLETDSKTKPQNQGPQCTDSDGDSFKQAVEQLNEDESKAEDSNLDSKSSLKTSGINGSSAKKYAPCQESKTKEEKGHSSPGDAHGLFKYFKKRTIAEQTDHCEFKGHTIESNNGSKIDEVRQRFYSKMRSPIAADRKLNDKRFTNSFASDQDLTIETLTTTPGILSMGDPGSPSILDLSNGVVSAKKPKKVSASPKNSSKKLEQLYIDVGQKSFGHTSCPTCGMVYTKTLPEDALHHSKYHQNLMQKLKFKGWKTERVLTEFHDGRIIQINPEDNSMHLKKVTELRGIVDTELGFAYATTMPSEVEKVFLFISCKKIVGCAIAVPIKKAYPVITTQDVPSPEKRNGAPTLSWCCSSEPAPALCGISRIWVLKQARRQKIASRLIDHVRSCFIYGVNISKKELAFSDPTPDGRLFAEKYSETPNFLVFR